MASLPSTSIRTLLLGVIAIVAIPCAGIIVYSGFQLRNEVLADARRRTQTIAARVASEQQNMIVGAEQLLASLAQIPEITNHDAGKMQKLLATLVAMNPQYANLFVTDRYGQVICSAIPLKSAISVADRRNFKTAMATGRFSSGEFLISRTANKPAINYAYPYRNMRGERAGVIVATSNLDYYRSYTEDSELAPNSGLVLLDHAGTVLFSSPGIRPKAGERLRADLYRQMVNGPNEYTGFIDSMDGDRRIMSYRKLYIRGEPTPYMYVRIGIPYDETLAAANAMFLDNVTLFLSFLCAAVALALITGKHFITNRISLLAAATRQLADGERNIRISGQLTGGELGVLAHSFDHMVEQINRQEHELYNRGEQLRVLFETSQAGIVLIDPDGTIRFANSRMAEMFGYSHPDELIGSSYTERLHPEQRSIGGTRMRQLILGEIDQVATERHYIRKDGSDFWGYLSGRRQEDSSGDLIALIAHILDVTDRKKAEEERLKLEQQILHTQKLESLGILAGGIAHDFNNILMAIIGNADLALMRVSKESPVADHLRRIEQAAAQAADLARQMLAYSGKGKFVVDHIDLSCLLQEMLHMLEVSVSKKAVLRLNLTPNLPLIEADATQMRQIIMNLIINASEAIGDKSGVIAITTGCMDCDRDYLNHAWLDDNITEGLYVYLEIADTGCGMDKETLARIFDPFFTTKFTGRGLGMSAVLGIVRGHKGAIKIYSEVGRGSTFKVLLPAGDRPAELFRQDTGHDDWQGSGAVLLVDDEETVRAIGKEMLLMLGFQVLTADDGRAALEIFRSTPGIAFVILDLTMPHMDGEECFRELRRLQPDIKVLMSSGYNEQEVSERFAGKGLAGFIQKPYNLSVLREAIKRL
jgi:PAS domain S-box-containing protein